MNLTKIREKFKNKDLFDQALTHKSWVNENKNIRETYERLEFLGDAVLEFIVSDYIFKNFPDKEEGYLTALRANLVNTQNLASVAINLNLGREIFLSKGEDEGGGRNNKSLLADTVEAIIGAIFLDLGFKSAQDFINENILKDAESKSRESLKDSKSLLQEKLQAMGIGTPKYKVIEESGPDHDKKFVVEVSVGNKSLAKGIGKSKSTGEQEAAKVALQGL